MQITFYDKNMHETAVADNALLNAIKINKASLTSFFEEATHQVEFEFSKEFGEWWGIKENGYLAFRFRGEFFRFSIVKFKENAKSKTISIIGDYFNLEMLSENCLAYENQPARTIVEHLTAMEFLPYANFEIGVNELATSKKTLKYEGEDVKYKRLISIINNFGGECEFEIKQKRNGQFDKLVLNIYKANDGVNYQGVGRNRRDFEITIDNSNDVSRTFDMTDIKTAIEPIGKDGLRLGNRGTVWKSEQGQTEFFQKNNRIYAPIAAENMPKVLDIDDYLLWKLNIDTDDVAKLESEGLKWIKNVCYGKETIEVSGSFDVRVGDTVIINHKGIGRYGLLGSLRVSKIVWDLLTEKNEVTFANFKRLASKISAQGIALQNSIESPASYDLQFNTTGGTVFKNNTGLSNVSFNFSKNGAQTAVLGQRWYNGTQLLSNGLEVMIKPNQLVDGKLVLRLEVDVTNTITYSKELTFINVNDGAKGDQGKGISSTENYYLVSASKTGITSSTSGWVKDTPQIATATNKYHWHYRVDVYSDGTRKEFPTEIIGIYGDKGDSGNGIKSTSVSYGLSSSASTQPTTWTGTIPTASPTQYLWTRKITDYTDATKPDTIELIYSYQGKNGTAGTSVTVSKIEYQSGTSGTTAPTGTWTTAIPSVPEGQFLWSKTTLSDNNVIYTIARQGSKGADGKTPYWHTAYANSADGKVGFSVTDSTGKQYIGQYTDYISSDSTDPTKYKWVNMVGSVSVGGVNLLLNSDFEVSENRTPFTVGGVTYSKGAKYWSTYNSGITNPTTSYHAYLGSYGGRDNVIVFNESDGTRHWKGTSFGLNGRTPQNTNDFVFSFDSYSTNMGTKIFGGIYYVNKNTGTFNFHAGQYTIKPNIVNNWERLSIKVPFDFSTCDYSKGISFYIYGYGFSANAIHAIDNVQLENATVSSNYDISPTEKQAKLDETINSKADAVLTQDQLNALSEKQGLIHAELEAKASAAILDNWIKAYQEFVQANNDARAKAEKDLIAASQRVSTIAKDLGELSDRWNFIDTYMTSSNEGLVIGKTDGSSSMLFSPNGRISMFSAGQEVMYISQGVIHIENGIFSKTIQIGRFREEQYHINPDMNVIRYVG